MQKYTIKVVSPEKEANVKVTKDYSEYYSGLSKEWAVSKTIVENEDYSAKHYANVAKQNVQEASEELQEEMQNQVNIATQKAQIATDKAAELISANKANADFSNITEAAENLILDLADNSADITRIDSELDTKADVDLSNCSRPYVSQSYRNTTTWYRVWSDGWIEQGGFSKGAIDGYVIFAKEFTTLNYYPLATKTTTNLDDYAYINILEKQLTKMKCDGAWNTGHDFGYSFYWYVCGY